MRRLIGGLLILAGLGLLLLAGIAGYDAGAMFARTEHAQGVIVDPLQPPAKARPVMLELGLPVVAIDTPLRGTVFAHLEIGPAAAEALTPGDTVPVRFDPQSPATAWLATGYAMFGVPGILAAVAVIALVAGGVIGRASPAPVVVAGRPVPRPRSSSGRVSLIRDRPMSTVTRGGERGLSAVALLALLLLIIGAAVWIGLTLLRTPGLVGVPA